MRKVLIAAALALSAAALAPSAPANAQVSVTIGSDGYHHRHWDRGYHRGWRAYGAVRCRTVITHRWRHGHRVTVRRQICG